MSEIGRAVQWTTVTPEFFEEFGMTAINLPPIHWFVEGPRGGIYEATGLRTRSVVKGEQLGSEWYWRRPDGMLYALDKSEGVRYVRPGTARHREAKAMLP